MVETPRTAVGTLVMIGAILVALVFLFTTNLWAFIVGAGIVAAILYAIYVVGLGLHRRLLQTLSGQRGGR